jgi:hypothetical protein
MLKIRALVDGHVIADIPVGNLFMAEALAGRGTVVNASNGVIVQIIENDKPIIERRYSEAEIYPFKDSDEQKAPVRESKNKIMRKTETRAVAGRSQLGHAARPHRRERRRDL